jgi:hypothetical protein
MEFILSLILFASSVIVQEPAIMGSLATIDELASMYDIEKCLVCHEDIHQEWSHSMHSKSIIDPRVIRTWRTFILSGLDTSPAAKRRDLKDVCLPCHAPQTKDASDEMVDKIAGLIITAADDKDKKKTKEAIHELSRLNINCIICHSLKGSPDGKPGKKTIYGPNGSGELPHKEALGYDTVKSSFLPTPEFCAQCHHGCPPGMPSTICPTVYSSYREDYVAGGGTQRCQACHMKGEDRASHRFPGIYEIDFVKSGIDLSVKTLPTTYIFHLENRMVPAVVMNVRVQNTAGHLIPHG